MRIVVAPDSFKESMTAVQAARAMAAGIRDVLPSCAVARVPVSDGGEGFAEAVTAAWGASWREVTTVDALGRPRIAGFGLDGERAVVDLASSVGLEHVAPGERDVMRSSTLGLGRVIAAAVDARARSLLIGLGGSASNDMGLGMLVALGARCLDGEGGEVEPVPAELSRIRSIDAEPARRRLEGISITVAGDVTNPLTGPHGAAAVFGPQKGLTEPAITRVDGEMARLADVLGLSQWVSRPGTGAAGGTAFALAAVLGAQLATGIDHLTRVVGLREQLNGADLLLTGEGALDGQSLDGKAVSGVLRLAHECRVPSIVFAGRVSMGVQARRRLADLGARDIVQISDPSEPLETSLRRGPDHLRRAVAHALRQ
ncbi:glycerate kinase [Actinomyces sp. ZJ308]|uniref:glycerate kinase n=1 Tax=Actinomyces sp. ZJ308 TaxID=2708342 RepID=UPI0014238321|nr:glycerate kinase [Actinomyces sp. ZJ308]